MKGKKYTLFSINTYCLTYNLHNGTRATFRYSSPIRSLVTSPTADHFNTVILPICSSLESPRSCAGSNGKASDI